MKEKYIGTILSIVKQQLSTGVMSVYDNFQNDLLADPEDVMEIIEAVEKKFDIEFNDSEHFKSTSVVAIADIVAKKKPESHLASFGGPIYAV